MLEGSRNHKARLLHYFPADGSSSADDVAGAQDQEWCGWHTDHGSLTGEQGQAQGSGGRGPPTLPPA